MRRGEVWQWRQQRFDLLKKEWIQACAKINGQSFSDFVRQSALERVEEMADVYAYEEALALDDATRYLMDEVMHLAMMTE